MSLVLLLLLGCDGKQDAEDDTGTPSVATPVCTEPVEVACVDKMILDLSLHDDLVSDGEVANTTGGEDFVTTVNADAAGIKNASENPWVYVKFTSEGARRVDIDDEKALTSMDWDLAANASSFA